MNGKDGQALLQPNRGDTSPTSVHRDDDTECKNLTFRQWILSERRKANTTAGFLRSIFAGLNANMITLAFYLFLLIVFAIANIAVAASRWNEPCTSERIRVFLVVSGVASLLLSFSLVREWIVDRRRTEHRLRGLYYRPPLGPLFTAVSWITLLFGLGWFFAGNGWVYGYDPGPNFEHCDKVMYLFAFWYITTTYILLTASVLLTCCGCCFLAFWVGNPNEDDEQIRMFRSVT